MKTKIRKASLGALVAVLLAALLMAALPSVAHAAHAAESAAVRVDFTDDSAYTAERDVTAGEGGARLANGARVAVKESFTSFLCYIDVTSESAFTLSFGGGSLRFTGGRRFVLHKRGDILKRLGALFFIGVLPVQHKAGEKEKGGKSGRPDHQIFAFHILLSSLWNLRSVPAAEHAFAGFCRH